MKRSVLSLAAGATLLAGVAVATSTASAAAPAPAAAHLSARVCGPAPAGTATCHARVVVDAAGKPVAAATPSGYGPADIQSAYSLPGTGTGAPTVAIVDAYDDPTAEADLGVYRSQYALPPCTTANGCFRKVNQNGGTKMPRVNGGWAQEISLDLDMVSAACPSCKILLVEASSASFSNLGTAVNYAATQGVAAISNSYGGGDTSQMAAYNHPGIAITASTGDNGYGSGAPATFNTVVAVGGTSLTRAGSGWSESAWSGAGSACSTLNTKPSWQSSIPNSVCTGRVVADVSAVADPATGVAVYDSTAYQGRSGWMVFGGTSASAPIIASVYAMAGNLGGYPASYTWAHTSGLHDVTTGSNGTCSVSVLCHAGTGWDGPTGLGTPNGLSAF